MSNPTTAFKIKADSKTFLKMREFLKDGNDAKVGQVVAVTAMMNDVTEDIVRAAFDAAVSRVEASEAVNAFESSEVEGCEVSSSLIDLVRAGRALAERFGGTVQFVLDSDGDGNVSVKPRFRGIEGVGSSSGGNGASGVRYSYSCNGESISGKVEEFILNTFPESKTAGIFNQYREARDSGKTSRIGAIDALERGSKMGDSLGITWEKKTPE